MELSWIDLGIAIILLISVGIAMFRGFVKEAISLASWIIAIWLAMTFSSQVALFLPSSIDEATINLGTEGVEASKLRVGIAFILIIVGTLIAGSLLNYILSQLTQTRALRGIDRILGAFFGVVRGAAVVVIVILLASLTSFPRSDIWKTSQFLPPFELAARKVIDIMPPEYSKYFSFDDAELQASSYTL
ncbi:MAG: CvpA family protein [Gammaproteobacteria bacterium]